MPVDSLPLASWCCSAQSPGLVPVGQARVRRMTWCVDSPEKSPGYPRGSPLRERGSIRQGVKKLLWGWRSKKDECVASPATSAPCVPDTKPEEASTEPQGEPERSNSFVAPVWERDQSRTCCPLCSVKFTLFLRRHHCRRWVCTHCLSSLFPTHLC